MAQFEPLPQRVPAARHPYGRLSRAQLGGVVGGIVAAHLAAGWGLMQVAPVRQAVIAAVPMFFEVVAEPAPEPAPPPPRPTPVRIAPPAAVIAAQTPEPASFVAAPAEPMAVVGEPDSAPAEAAPPQAPAAAAPRLLPASAIQYLVPPDLQYPRISRRLRESGEAVVRVYVDEAGLPRAIELSRSSGFERLDEAALRAVQRARFKPYTENGRPVAGWALVPLFFDLE